MASKKSSFIITTRTQTSTLTHTTLTPFTTYTTTIPDHLHEITMRGGGQVWAVVKILCFQGFVWCLRKCEFIPEFIGKKRLFFHKTGLQT